LPASDLYASQRVSTLSGISDFGPPKLKEKEKGISIMPHVDTVTPHSDVTGKHTDVKSHTDGPTHHDVTPHTDVKPIHNDRVVHVDVPLHTDSIGPGGTHTDRKPQ
jgi:hypothetical protein